MAQRLHDRNGVDIGKRTDTMLAKKRWKDLKGAEAYGVSRSVLVSSTDGRRSNYAKNGDVVTDRATAKTLSRQLAEPFKRPGYPENQVNCNCNDYVAIGLGKTPTALIYLYQLVAYALPAQDADSRPIKHGKTAVDTFRGTIVELEGKVAQLTDHLASQDAYAFLAHSQFLHEKFGSANILTAPPCVEPDARALSAVQLRRRRGQPGLGDR